MAHLLDLVQWKTNGHRLGVVRDAGLRAERFGAREGPRRGWTEV